MSPPCSLKEPEICSQPLHQEAHVNISNFGAFGALFWPPQATMLMWTSSHTDKHIDIIKTNTNTP